MKVVSSLPSKSRRSQINEQIPFEDVPSQTRLPIVRSLPWMLMCQTLVIFSNRESNRSKSSWRRLPKLLHVASRLLWRVTHDRHSTSPVKTLQLIVNSVVVFLSPSPSLTSSDELEKRLENVTLNTRVLNLNMEDASDNNIEESGRARWGRLPHGAQNFLYDYLDNCFYLYIKAPEKKLKLFTAIS